MFFKLKKIFLIGIALVVANSHLGAAENPLKIVTTQVIYADIVKKIGGDKVEVNFIASPKFNVHSIQPKPSDVRNIARADLVIYTGLDLEEWWGPLVEAAGKPDFFAGRQKCLDLSKGITLLNVPSHSVSRAQGDVHLFGNPHYQMNPENAKIMAGTILEKLKEVDPRNAEIYEANQKAFVLKLDEKISQWKALTAHARGQEILSYHDDIAYLANFLGVKVEQFLEPKPGVPPTPKHLQFLENYASQKGIKAIVMSTYFPKDAAENLSKKLGLKVVTICQNVGELEGTEDIFSFFDYNFNQIAEALK